MSDENTKILKAIQSNTTIVGLILFAILVVQVASCEVWTPSP